MVKAADILSGLSAKEYFSTPVNKSPWMKARSYQIMAGLTKLLIVDQKRFQPGSTNKSPAKMEY